MTLLLIKVKLIFFFKIQNSIARMMSTRYERSRGKQGITSFFNDNSKSIS